MARGGKREGAGRPKNLRVIEQNAARKLKAQINAEQKWLLIIEKDTALAMSGKTGPLRTDLIYLDNRDLGTCIETVNHLHDKPIDLNVSLSLSERMMKALDRAEQRVGRR